MTTTTELTITERVWHRAYVRWYDHDRAGHRRRAAVWGWVADRHTAFGISKKNALALSSRDRSGKKLGS